MTSKHIVRLVHWKAAEAPERVERLRSAGFEATYRQLDTLDDMKALSADPGDAVVIDLGRLPSHGREFGVYLRSRKSSRGTPLLFVGGAPDKVQRVRDVLPDAAFASWSDIGEAIRCAIRDAPAAPHVPISGFEAYSSTPLVSKLGIRAGYSVLLVDAPAGFEETLGPLPEGVSLHARPDDPRRLAIWFVRSRSDIVERLDNVLRGVDVKGSLWIAWPKKASGVPSDLTQVVVRDAGLELGLVDYKICSIDGTWSGLLFTRRDRDRTDAAVSP
ncbi:MAG: hypothetical protein OYI31_03055 [Chloroflexota bacterium]|nr:hypothetical protein [Chloroflexota bacterium]MDE2941050.1 hypothetical protein [Chloroflexota bacterium]MDE3267424.1 hypothetical protein [Chloroflexota bacterium]